MVIQAGWRRVWQVMRSITSAAQRGGTYRTSGPVTAQAASDFLAKFLLKPTGGGGGSILSRGANFRGKK